MSKKTKHIKAIWNASSLNPGFAKIVRRFALISGILGIGTMIVVMSVLEGFHNELKRIMIGFQGDICILAKNGKEIINYEVILSNLKSHKKDLDLKAIIPVMEGNGAIKNGNSVKGVFIKGLEFKNIKDKIFLKELDAKSPLMEDPSIINNYANIPKAYIGFGLANSLQLCVGDKLSVMSDQLIQTPIGTIPKSLYFEIAGIFKTGRFDYDNHMIYTTNIAANILLSNNFKVEEKLASHIEIYLKKGNIKSKIKKIKKILGENFLVKETIATNPIFNALKVEKISMFIVTLLIILVVIFNITTVLYMLIQSKTRDIAILKTLGASTKDIINTLIFFSGGVAIKGALFGSIFAYLFLFYMDYIKQFLEKFFSVKVFDPQVYFLNKIPYDITWSVILIPIITVIFTLLASLLPAIRASKKDPAEVLRNV